MPNLSFRVSFHLLRWSLHTTGSTPHLIIIDASTDFGIAALHPHWLKSGAHVVTANKRAISSSLELYNAVYSAVRTNNRMYMSEVTIGAALPIQTTLNDLLCSGDAVHSIVGLMSVSAGVILSAVCEDGLSFSAAVEKTYSTGLFEDDVFVDLEGTEAAQKLLILGRELGCPMSIEDIVVEPLATRRKVDNWGDLKVVFAKEDIDMARRAKEANAKGCTLRYVQRIECSTPAGFGSGCPIQVRKFH
jgi:bifunctional aspartokinase / homoserine dehydrogenase 1